MSGVAQQKESIDSSKIIRLLLFFLFLNGVCDGSLMTSLAVYISDVKGMGFRGVSVFYTSFGVSSVVISLLTTSSVGNISIMKRACVGTILLAVGYPMVLLVNSSGFISIPGMICGAGMSLYISALIGFLNDLSTDATRRTVFSQRNLYVNAGQCIGSLLIGSMIYFFGNAIANYFLIYKLFCMLFFGVICWVKFNSDVGILNEIKESFKSDIDDRKSNMSMIFFALLFNFLATMIVVGQIDTVLPLIATELMHVDVAKFSTIIVANTLTVVFFQSYVSKISSHIGEGKVLTLSAVLWVISYLWCLIGICLVPGQPTMILVVFSIISGVGQCLFSSAYYPYISKASSSSDFKRFSSASSAAFNCGKALGLSYSGFALKTQDVYFVWWYLMLSCLAMLVYTAGTQVYIEKSKGNIERIKALS
ncbi:MFS transporter [Pseudomonas orientalis]|uniref:Major Facilitator Superfamily protein n=1 Tax=Pseudomonas orientalis TaxID=76758 RepID=A0A8B3Y3T5_9PSED|nr:MFS transporter [Pseudomonas orientalis]SDU23278.1 Major Facilitator Superfamily protein [Pseudomonas orientalis]